MESTNLLYRINHKKSYLNYYFFNSKIKIKNKYIEIKYMIFLINVIILIIIYLYTIKNNISKFKIFIRDCTKFKKYNNIMNDINEEKKYLSICLPVYNMEKYIGRALFSIINQSFKNIEIIAVNDNSNDNTEKIIRRLQSEDNRIKIINHYKNLGVYSSRKDGILNAKGEFILLIDPDDMLLNRDIFQELYNYNLKYNLDMIEFTVFHQIEGENNIFFPISQTLNHYHNFNKNIIYQPELSDIIFYIPNSKNYSSIICRTIWNKIIRKDIMSKTIEYTELDFHNQYLITADDTPLNIINFFFAKNYSNINVPGYLYNIRKNSMSKESNDDKHNKIISYNYLLYYKLLYRYIKENKKNINFLLFDLEANINYLLKIRNNYLTKYLIKFFDNVFKNLKILNLNY